jgi:uncharacterized protein
MSPRPYGTLWGGLRNIALAASTLALVAPNAAVSAQAPALAQIGRDYVRTSEYVTMRDGIKLAIDIMRPARNGVPVPGKFPIVFQATPYQRAMVQGGVLVDAVDNSRPDRLGRYTKVHTNALVRNGYVYAALDLRGRGASFGVADPAYFEAGSDLFRTDMYDTVEWLAARSYSNGAVGQLGCSAVGRSVWISASAMPPHLKAIAPTGAPLDQYGATRPGGISQIGYFRNWDRMMRAAAAAGAPVDGPDAALTQQAIAEHQKYWADSTKGSLVDALSGHRPFRDSQTNTGDPVAMEYNYASNFALSQIPTLQISSWRDMFPQGALNWFDVLKRYRVPQQIVIGDNYHCEWYGNQDIAEAHVRWFDHYLKGISNGVDKDPPITYKVMGAPVGSEWKTSLTWPVAGMRPESWYFADSVGGTKASLNNGSLALTAPRGAGADAYTSDYSVTTADTLSTRWNIPKWGTVPLLDTRPIDAKSLTWDTPAFTKGTEFTGFPRLKLWVDSDAPNPDFYIYLSVVNPDGRTMLVTNGMIRGANRKTRTPPFDNGGLPWHASMQRDQTPLVAGTPALIDLALYPTSFWVMPGQKVRITINNFDKDMFDTPEEAKAPTIRVLRNHAHPSEIILPHVGK